MSAHPTQIQAAAQLQANTLFASLELSKARCRSARPAATSSRVTMYPEGTAKLSSSSSGACRPRPRSARARR